MQIEETVQRVIRKRFDEGQLDNCNLTISDLAKIKDAFVKNLIGVTHAVIKYESGPSVDDVESSVQAQPPSVDDAFGNRESFTGDAGPTA